MAQKRKKEAAPAKRRNTRLFRPERHRIAVLPFCHCTRVIILHQSNRRNKHRRSECLPK